ncbi:MAG: hypothetical protein V2B12_00840 [bacterium]
MKENLYLTKNTTINHYSLPYDARGLVVNISSYAIKAFDEVEEIWTAKPIDWLNSEESSFHSYSEAQDAFLIKTDLFFETSLLSNEPNKMYAISLSVLTLTVDDTISAVANALEFNNYFYPIILD